MKVEYKELFASLSVEGEVEHKLTSAWDGTTVTDPAVSELAVTLPYGTAASSIVPTFTLGDTIKKIEFEHGGSSDDEEKRTLTSGMTLPMDTSAGRPILSSVTDKSCKKDLTVTLDNGDEVTVSVVIEDKTDNPEAVLKSIVMKDSIGTKASVKEEVTGKNVTVEMPVGFDNTDATTATLDLEISPDATASIVGQNISVDDSTVATAHDGKVTLTGVDVRGAGGSKTFEILITSKDGESKERYRVTWHNAAKEEALLKSIRK